MSPDRDAVQDALQASYQKITAVTGALGDDELMLPTRCAGWAIGDVLYHQLLDARRALVTLATPADAGQRPDVDDITYWRPFSPRSGAASALGSPGAARHARHVRIVASAYPPGALASEWRETAEAAGRAARACPYPAVATQGHVLATPDFLATLTVEAAIHYLDLTVALPAAPPPDPAALALVRRVLDGLLGIPMAGPWDDTTYALKGTGREPVSAADRAQIGPLADLLPLLG
ncbi:MAG TPA: maleylpyruvate isomerase N-terminal domain-containing protein [Streptosporangiaceae bacterium]|jgi:uncharacterized protein (TIGR03083 family)